MINYNKPEDFDDESLMFQRLRNINSILDKLHDEIEAVKGVERFLHDRCNCIEDRIGNIEKKLEDRNETKEMIFDSVKKALGKEVVLTKEELKQSGIADKSDRLPTSPKKRGRPKLKVVWKPGDPVKDGVE